MKKEEKFVDSERQVFSKENYAKFLVYLEHKKELINKFEDKIKKAKKEKKFYEDAMKQLEGQKSLEVLQKLKDYQDNIKRITESIEIDMLFQTYLIRKCKTLEKTVVCEE